MKKNNDLTHENSSETSTTPLQPMRFIDILGGIFRLYRNHFRLFFGIAIVYLVSQLVFSIISRAPIEGIMSIVINGFTTLGNSLVFLLFWAALFYASAQAYLGNNITVRAAFGQALRRFWSYLGSTLLFGLLVLGSLMIVSMVGFYLFAADLNLDDLGPEGIISFFLSSIVAILFIIIIGMPVAIYFGVRWGFYPLAVLFEETTATNALRRSTGLIKGTWWRVFGILLGILLIATIIPFVLHWATVFFISLTGIVKTGEGSLLNEVGRFSSLIQNFVAAPINIIGTTLLYFDLRVRKEGLNIEMITANMEESSAPPVKTKVFLSLIFLFLGLGFLIVFTFLYVPYTTQENTTRGLHNPDS